MVNIAKSKYFYLFIICILIGRQVAFAADSFQNNLLKADVKKNSLGGVNLTLYTNNPYSDAVTVNKKSDNEYVILMPETSNSLTAKPSLSSVSDVISKVEIKTQQYSGNVKGYTKMVISTTKPIEIIPHVKTINPSDYELSENDYNDLLAQSKKEKGKGEKGKEANGKWQMANSKKQNAKSKVQSVKSEEEKDAKTQRRKEAKPNKNYASLHPGIFASKTVRHKTPSNVVKAPVSKPVEKPIVETPVTQTPVVQKPAVETPIVTPVVEKPIVSTPEAENLSQVSSILSKIKRRLPRLKRIIKNNIYTVFGLMAVGFILLLLMARKINRNIQKHKESFMNNLEEKPFNVKDYNEKITDDMTWKEKYQTYVETTNQTNSQTETKESPAVEANENLDELFGSDILQEEVKEETLFEEPSPKISEIDEALDFDDFDEFVKTSSISNILDNVGEEDSIEDLFAEEESLEGMGNRKWEIEEAKRQRRKDAKQDENYASLHPGIFASETSHHSPLTTHDESETVTSEFVIDDRKGLYLVDFEDKTALVGHIDDKVFVLKRFDGKIESEIQARLDEQKDKASNYMTKVGNFKGIVEVTPNDMNLLIEL